MTSNRIVLLGGLVAVLLVALFWLLLWNPKNEQLAELDVQIAEQQAQQVELAAQISGLQEVRASAPEIQALLAAAQIIVPHDPAIPSALRQIQQSASESGVTLRSVSPGRPAAVLAEVALEPGTELVGYPLGVLLEGSYFQVVDFLRRLEDPTVSPRGLVWSQLNSSVLDEHPTLSVNLSGTLYAVVPSGGLAEEAAEVVPSDGEGVAEGEDGEPAADPGSDAVTDPEAEPVTEPEEAP